MSEGKRFLDLINRLGYTQSYDLQAESFDWMFENEAVRPFLDWFCDNVGPSNLLTQQEVKQYNNIVESDEGVLEGAQLEKALQSSTSQTSEEITDEQLDEDITRLTEELQDCRNYKERLLQHRNKLSLHQAGLNHRLSKMGPIESTAEKQYRQCLEQKQTDNTQMNATLDKLSRTSSELVSMYNKSPISENVGQQEAPFLSQQSLQHYHGNEERFTQQLTAYTKKQFFEGIGDVAGHSEGSRYELLDISDPNTLTIRGEKPEVTNDCCEELARLKEVYPNSQKRRIKAVTEENRIAAACRLAGDRLQALNQQTKGSTVQDISDRNQETEKQLNHVQKEVAMLADSQVPKWIHENAELQGTLILYGDYNLKLARQDYFTSKQNELIKQLISQKARNDFLMMAYEMEVKGHKETHRLLTGTEQLLERNVQANQDRMHMMNDPGISVPHSIRNTVDSRDLFTTRLQQLVGNVPTDQQQLFLTYGNLVEGARRLAHDLDTLQATLSSTTSSQDSRLASLEQNLSVCEDMVYANSATKDGQPIMSPPQLIDGLTQLDQTIKNLEQTICDIITEHNSKTKSLKSDPFLSRQRQLFVYFFLEPSRLRRAVNELTQRLEAQLVS
ncbi:HAUS augmin-like complex subunit 3 [Amphiura filiformis]|uniref:HAUS augmin-like complex subunit 3 n=1 Tax=Amphiura filiformis TaxID=82378 RepID=UPI003B21B1AB